MGSFRCDQTEVSVMVGEVRVSGAGASGADLLKSSLKDVILDTQ